MQVTPLQVTLRFQVLRVGLAKIIFVLVINFF